MEMEKLRLRCPSCAKLYEVSEADIKSHSPQFDCVSCASRFSFEYPVVNLRQIEAFVVSTSPEMQPARSFQQELESAAQESGRSSDKKESTKACPKCGAINENKTGKKSDECYSCHVIFSRLEELPLDPTLKAQPSLVRKWKNLVLNFDNKELHDDFLNSCHKLEALRFAILKYEDVKSAQGGIDEISERMIFKAHGLLQLTLSGKLGGGLRFQKEKESVAPRQSWHKYILWAPLCVAILMISMGFFSLGLRNLVGAGVAVMLLTFGLILFWKGRISLSDFH
jgi:transposase-like protein